MFRQRTQVRETTPDASGNVFHSLERVVKMAKLATEQRVETHGRASLQCPKLVKVNEMHCNGQRGADSIGNDTRRPNNQFEDFPTFSNPKADNIPLNSPH